MYHKDLTPEQKELNRRKRMTRRHARARKNRREMRWKRLSRTCSITLAQCRLEADSRSSQEDNYIDLIEDGSGHRAFHIEKRIILRQLLFNSYLQALKKGVDDRVDRRLLVFSENLAAPGIPRMKRMFPRARAK